MGEGVCVWQEDSLLDRSFTRICIKGKLPCLWRVCAPLRVVALKPLVTHTLGNQL